MMKGKGRAKRCKPLPKESVAPEAMLLSRTENIAPMAATLLGSVLERPFSVVSHMCLKCESARRHFHPGEGPSLLRDCYIFANLCFTSLSQ